MTVKHKHNKGSDMQKVRDYFTVWNTGVSFIYGIIGLIYCSAITEAISLYNKYKEYGYYDSDDSIMTGDMVIAILFTIVFLATGVLNMIFTRRYFREEKAKSALGYTALGMLILSTGYMLVRMLIMVFQYAAAVSGSGYGIGYAGGISFLALFGYSNWLTWVFLAAVVFNFVSAILALVWLIKDKGDNTAIDPLAPKAGVATNSFQMATQTVKTPFAGGGVSMMSPAPDTPATSDNTPSQIDPLAGATVDSNAIYPNPFEQKEQ